MKFDELCNKLMVENTDNQEFGLGEKPEKLKVEWDKIREKYTYDEKYHKKPMWYIVQYALNDYESNRYYNNINDAWLGECSLAHDWAMNNDEDSDVLKKIREIGEKPVPKWFKYLYWDRIDSRITDKYGIFDYDKNTGRREK